MCEYCIKDSSILEVNGKRLNFIYKIKNVIDMNNIFIVLLDAEIKLQHKEEMYTLPNGIYGVSSEGKILWNIEIFFRPDGTDDSFQNAHSSKFIEINPDGTYNYSYMMSSNRFNDIKRGIDGNLVAYTDTGVAYVLDIEKKEITGHFKSERKGGGAEKQTINYRVKDNSILEIAGKQLDFVFNIEKVIEVENMLIIGLADIENLHNGIYAVSPEGKILWNIEEFFRPGNSYWHEPYPDEATSLLRLDDNGNLVIGNLSGEYIIDIKNKLIITHYMTR